MNTAVKSLVALVLVSLLMPSLSLAQEKAAAAQAAPAGGQYKIAVVNRKQVFDNYDRQKREWDALEAEKKQLQTKIDALSDSITADKKKLEEGTGMTDEQKTTLRDKIESDYRMYQAEFKRLQGEIDSKSRKFFGTMMEDIDKAINAIGVAENYHLIFEADPKSPTSVLYFSTTIDITTKVTDKLNGKK
ncbi:MAG: OmpH family outer membrane protein [Candidatus Hydrogenedentes bacterium]|nr:OmpH family outer membrane protein [Candidatus Hydrogenedentota bacterium]